ncbi:MAG: cobyric acid synthase CobQ [Candidatus Melainabacteria bacterium RIFOXYA12_FULL_32_12]|nr:MAG: cobyric acid synthase CobQ [Candidatus Melainabacteria bacterium RIFOXYA2_FULL_32_9]OGI28089.1 MAG: cobyric acid synthase CobQ [Candidatus Melainabacteria bacterium RIFOXYA12_FULL_32_12]
MSIHKNLLFIGTTSNAGKTFITGFAGKILKEKFGIKTCPFKAQNMSNYAIVCEYNKEISIAQASQAHLMNVEPKADMNPVLLKPLGEGRSQVIVRGVPKKITSARTYYQEIDTLKPEVDAAYEKLKQVFDMLVIEGAGSGFELNLKNRDLANQHMMEKEDVNTVLITNIEDGGVFASILGSYQLMSDDIKSRFKGVIINNFRGDVTLFDEGREIIEKWGIPVLGVIPNINYGLDSEDSLAIMQSYDDKNRDLVQVGVIKYPRASNINDIEPLVHDPNVQVSFITQRTNLDIFDKVILPGSRAVLDDLRWLKKTGIAEDLKNTKAEVYGICGGYQMLHKQINDPLGSESGVGDPESEAGLGFIPGTIEFKQEKVLKRQDYSLYDGIIAHGFEMHTGISDSHPVFFDSPKIKGSMVHEIFHNDNFRNWWLTHNTGKTLQEWSFSSWKKAVQDKVSLRIEEIINWERMLG